MSCPKEIDDARPAVHPADGGVPALVPAPGEIPRGGDEMMQIITGIAAVALVVYLFMAIVKPEKF
jgi:K+-transporting ATPase KdpF subunit